MPTQQNIPERAEWMRAILDRYQSPLISYAARITGDLERAREVVQDTFLRLCRENPAKVQDHLAQWLFTVCRNRALDVRRKERRLRLVVPEGASQRNLEAAQEDRLAREERLERVLEILEMLPANQQEVVRLKFQQDLSYREIAAVTSLSVSNVGFLLHTALKSIRRHLESESSPAQASAGRTS